MKSERMPASSCHHYVTHYPTVWPAGEMCLADRARGPLEAARARPHAEGWVKRLPRLLPNWESRARAIPNLGVRTDLNPAKLGKTVTIGSNFGPTLLAQ